MFISRLTALAALSLGVPALAAQLCNGRSEYCSRIWSNVSQIGSHDSGFVGILPTDNQYITVANQLKSGVRFLQAQTHKNVFGKLDLCHTSCLEKDAGSVISYLQTIKSFLDSNPNEVVTLLLTNGDNLDPSVFDSAFQSSGIKNYTFVPEGSPAVLPIGLWPTYSQLISAGTRLVFFLDYGANMAKYPYILDEFSYFFETAFDVTDPNFSSCALDRPAHASPNGRMYIVNHFLDVNLFNSGIDVPDVAAIQTTNAAMGQGSIGAQVAECEGLYPYAPKGVLLDFVNEGQAMQAQLAMNHLS